jgi:hypothetical protein
MQAGNGSEWLVIDDVSVKDLNAGGKEMLINGGFEDWPESVSHLPPPGWRFFLGGCSRGTMQRMRGRAPELKWETGLKTASDLAARNAKKLLIFYDSPTASAAKHYTTVFADPEVALFLRDHFVLLRLTMEKHSDVAAQMNVFRGGAICIYSAMGQGIHRIDDQLSAAELIEQLKQLK